MRKEKYIRGVEYLTWKERMEKDKGKKESGGIIN
jgi:hypothetical protein